MMSNKRHIPGYVYISALKGFNDFTKNEIKKDKGDGIRTPGDEQLKEEKDKMLGWFLKGYTLRQIKRKLPDKKIMGISNELEDMCTQYGTVPFHARHKTHWQGLLWDKEEPRENFAHDEHWINPFDMSNEPINPNQIWWVRNRIASWAPRGEFTGMSWKRLSDELGMPESRVRKEFKHLLPKQPGLIYKRMK